MQNPSPAMRPPVAGKDGGFVNYPFNHWWVAALSEEVQPGQMLERRILGKSVVLFRTSDGAIAALENRCPHRQAPLSLGEIRDDTIMCRYHGFRYGSDGKCKHIPTQATIPANAIVKAYPIREIKPLIWIWTGDPALAGESSPTPLSWLDDPEYALIGGYMPLKANYMSLKENVLDLTHFGYVHASTFKVTDWVKPPATTVGEDGSVRFEIDFEDVGLPAMYQGLLDLDPDRRCDRRSWGRSLSPAIHEACLELTVRDTAPDERRLYRSRYSHITTPETPGTAHYWWFRGGDFGQNNKVELEKLRELIVVGFMEDKAVLEAIQAAADADPDYISSPEVSVQADRSGLQARRMLDRLLRKEQQIDG